MLLKRKHLVFFFIVTVLFSLFVLRFKQKTAVTLAQKNTKSTFYQSAACKIKSAKLLAWGMAPNWSLDDHSLIFNDRDEKGVYQLFRINPDGANKICLTCTQKEGGPSVGVNKGNVAWYPGGKYLVVHVEMEKHIAPKALTESGRGINNDIWLMTPGGEKWTKLTNYSPLSFEGVLYARFSPDGKKLLWSERTKANDFDKKTRIFGVWQLVIADFIDGPSPKITNIEKMKPGNGYFYEPHGFSPDGSDILFTADIGRSKSTGLDIFLMNLTSQKLTNLTNSDAVWDEHGLISPSGKKIIYMSSNGIKQTRGSILNTEEFLMNIDGSNKTQLTHFNTKGYPESTEETSAAAMGSWKHDGTAFALEQIFSGASYNKDGGSKKDRRIWIFTFAGACGAL